MTNPADEKAKIPVNYVLYAHYANEGKDFEDWVAASKPPPAQLNGVRFLLDRLGPLHNLLTTQGFQGVLVLFYAPGLHQCLDLIADAADKFEPLSRETLLSKNPKLEFAEAVRGVVQKELRKDGELSRRVRFVTALDLFDIFSGVKEHPDELRKWFISEISDDENVRYDSPKIVEAIVRLRLLGNGVPVFRLDWDVLFSENNFADQPLGEHSKVAPEPHLGLFKAIAICQKAYKLRLNDPSVATFLFSASYDSSSLSKAGNESKFDDWRGAFATRVFPAIRVMPERVSAVNNKEITWDQYTADAFDDSLARQFYGFLQSALKCDGPEGSTRNGLAQIGGHPLTSVISGAFLCLSDSAILDLPPFSNFNLNVVWIDDHLKYGLHRELRHLTTHELRLAADLALSPAKLDGVMVRKLRPPTVGDLPAYVLNKYLPQLLWGAVTDSWIIPDALLKYRRDELSETDQQEWDRLARRGESTALLPLYLRRSLGAGRFSGSRRELKKQLLAKALERINKVRIAWSQLIDKSHEPNYETFASLWAKGLVEKSFDLGGPARGIAPGLDIEKRVENLGQLNPDLLADLRQLAEDAVEYIEWTLHWPRIVRIVRSIEQGTLRTDMSWLPDVEAGGAQQKGSQ